MLCFFIIMFLNYFFLVSSNDWIYFSLPCIQRDSVALTNQNNELKFRLQAMEQQAQLRDGIIPFLYCFLYSEPKDERSLQFVSLVMVIVISVLYISTFAIHHAVDILGELVKMFAY